MTTDPTPAAGCPFHGPAAASGRKTRPTTPRPEQAVQLDERGHYRVSSFEAARQVLRSDDMHQAGFFAETVRDAPGLGRAPVLYAEGEHHHEMRRSTARFFTPAAVSGYTPMMSRLADNLMARLARAGEADLDDLSLLMAVDAVAQVVGLTSSAVPGLGRRMMAFFQSDLDSAPGAAPGADAGLGGAGLGRKLQALLSQSKTLAFFLLDVKPAIAARRRALSNGTPGDDLISHLLERRYTDLEILTECITYGTAGMVTTREFVLVAAWHLLERPELKNEYLHALEAERHALLQEILRLEPVVSQVFRRSQREMTVGGVTVPRGSIVALDMMQVNTDAAVAGDDALNICPGRALPRGVQPPVLAFGDGHHRCPGAYLAIRESDIFLRRLLMLDVRIIRPPDVTYNKTTQGYELRGFRVGLGEDR